MSFSVRRVSETPKKTKKPFPWKKWAIVALEASGPALRFLQVLGKRYKEQKKRKEREQLLKKVFVVAMAILLGVILLAETANALFHLNIISLRNLVSVAADAPQTDKYGHTNVLLLGKGDATHDGVDLTDTMMVASIDAKKTKGIVMFSIPRDLYLLSTEKMGEGKINTMYRDYKITLIRAGTAKEVASKVALKELGSELGKVLGIDIHAVAMVDFSGFIEAVDALGGVEIDVPSDLVDTQYPADENSYTTFSLAAGRQKLDGETALKYARSRHSTSDFDRSRRQQQILRALADKVKSQQLLSRPSQVMSLMRILDNHIETTMTVRQILGLVQVGMGLDQANIRSVQLNDRSGLYGSIVEAGGLLYTPPRTQFKGQSVLLPISIPEYPVTWKQIKLLTNLMIHTRIAVVSRIPINVLNAGAKPGSSRRLANELTRFGFIVGNVENAPNKLKIDSSIIAADVDTKELSNFLSTTFTYNVVPNAQYGTQGLNIILGKDFEYAPLQSLLVTQ